MQDVLSPHHCFCDKSYCDGKIYSCHFWLGKPYFHRHRNDSQEYPICLLRPKKKKMAEENEIHFASGCHFLTVQGNDLLLVNIPEIREVLVLSCYCTHARKRYVLSHLSTTWEKIWQLQDCMMFVPMICSYSFFMLVLVCPPGTQRPEWGRTDCWIKHLYFSSFPSSHTHHLSIISTNLAGTTG